MNKRVPVETVIEILENYKEYIEPQKEESLELSYAIGRAVESLKHEGRIKWIPIDQRLPTEKDGGKDGWVLTKYARGQIKEAMWTYLLTPFRKFEDDEEWKNIISWAPMPED